MRALGDGTRHPRLQQARQGRHWAHFRAGPDLAQLGEKGERVGRVFGGLSSGLFGYIGLVILWKECENYLPLQ